MNKMKLLKIGACVLAGLLIIATIISYIVY